MFFMIWISLVFFSKRIINLAPTPTVPPTVTVPSLNRAQFRVTCGHCNEIFMVGTCTFWLIQKITFHGFFVVWLTDFVFYSNIQFHTTSHLARCPHCRRMWVQHLPFSSNFSFVFNWSVVFNLCDQCVYFRSSVGNHFAKTRATIFAIIGFIFLAAGVGVTVGTLNLAGNSGGKWISMVLSYVLNIKIASSMWPFDFIQQATLPWVPSWILHCQMPMVGGGSLDY